MLIAATDNALTADFAIGETVGTGSEEGQQAIADGTGLPVRVSPPRSAVGFSRVAFAGRGLVGGFTPMALVVRVASLAHE